MKNIFLAAVILMSTVIFSAGCKKDSGSNGTSVNPYETSIVNRTWWGMFTYAGDTTEYYSVHFNPDSSVTWNQTMGEYGGRWSLAANHLTISFGPANVINADITSDNRLTNIKTNTTSVINSGQLMINPNQQPLDGTTWKGVFRDRIGSTYNFEMIFMPGSTVQIDFDGTLTTTYTYTRSASGETIRTTSVGDNWFGIIMSDTEIEGCQNPENKWELTKQ